MFVLGVQRKPNVMFTQFCIKYNVNTSEIFFRALFLKSDACHFRKNARGVNREMPKFTFEISMLSIHSVRIK